jgi:sulfur relay (sulfurtransferase) DsrF/TusC family protein
MKHIVVIVRRSPLNTLTNAEALRMSVGLTLRDDKVTVIFLSDAVWNAANLHPDMINTQDIAREIEMLAMLNHDIYVDEASLKERNIEEVNNHITVIPREKTISLLEEADVVIPF